MRPHARGPGRSRPAGPRRGPRDRSATRGSWPNRPSARGSSPSPTRTISGSPSRRQKAPETHRPSGGRDTPASRPTGRSSPSAAVRRQHRRLRRPGRGRRAEAPDLAPGRRLVGFTPDGTAVLFSSRARSPPGATPSSSPCRSRAVPDGDADPDASKAPISPDGRTIAYNPFPRRSPSGNTTAAAGLADLDLQRRVRVEKVPQPAGRCNDVDPMWVGKNGSSSVPTATASSTSFPSTRRPRPSSG